MQRSSLSLRDFILWTQTRLQPQTWSLTLRLWWPTLRPALRQIAPQSREKSRFISTAISRYIAVFLCPKSFFFCFQLLQLPEWECSLLQAHLRCSAVCAGQLQQDDWTGRELQLSAAGWAGQVCQGNYVQHSAGTGAVCFSLQQG